ncbi:CAP domain-containing protein [Chytriomyces cf. hyalinus JEL632]|nr:CAP domain-containing protein [Chytriomyces cf. hyalinus JEL632]
METSGAENIPSTTTTVSETTTASLTETRSSSTFTHSTTTTATLSNSQQKALSAHNNFRSGYGMPTLQYDITIESSAKRHAESLASTECKAVVQTTGTAGHGQNVAYWTSSTPVNFDIAYFARMWQNTNTSANGVSSATQMLWKSTERVGCYVANGSVEEEFCQIAVCEYSPPGNVQGYNWKEGS